MKRYVTGRLRQLDNTEKVRENSRKDRNPDFAKREKRQEAEG